MTEQQCERPTEPKLDYEQFTELPEVEQKVLIYLTTGSPNTDIGFEELCSPDVEIAENPDKVRSALNNLVDQNLVKRGWNPKRVPLVAKPASEADRFYLELGVREFVEKDLPSILKEKRVAEVRGVAM